MIKELKNKLDEINKAIEVNNDWRSQLTQRKEAIESNIIEINEKIEAAEASKAEALQRFAQGITADTEVEKARAEIKSLKDGLEEQNELLDAINVEFEKTVDCCKEVMEATHMPNRFRAEKDAAERALWAAIHEKEVVKSKKEIETAMLRAYCSARKSSEKGFSDTMLSFRDFLERFFDSSFLNSAREESQKYEPKILKEYL